MNPVSLSSSVSTDRRVATRSRRGCWTCRLKKVKCDEEQPQCQRCRRLRRLCDYRPRPDPRSGSAGSWNSSNPGELTLQLPAFSSSPSAVELTATDHEAIRYFRTTFARRHHTKNADYSVYSIMFKIAEKEPLVMHTLLAVGCRGIEMGKEQLAGGRQAPRQQSFGHLFHYSSALKQLTEELAKDNNSVQNEFNMDVCCTALYLMLLYEQNYGDLNRLGLKNHLIGAAMILRHHGRHIKTELETIRLTTPSALSRRGSSGSLSLYSARILIWILLIDASASTYGIGGAFNDALYEVLGYSGPDIGVERLHTFSNPLFRVMWGISYPQMELMDDIENRSVFELMVSCSQARYALALLARTWTEQEAHQRSRHLEKAKSAIQSIAIQYHELLEVANGLLPTTDNSHRLVANLRGVAPLYHAAVVLFARLTGDSISSFGRVEPGAHINCIMNLARQAYRHEGNNAMIRVAWPLIVVALETHDPQCREWIRCRFQALSSLNRNMECAYDFLSHYAAQPGARAPWTDPGKWFRSSGGDMFVI
ncbi:hypothetical protein NQ176_g4259 [Zarea fungicola]|uniref:Uncharacterized protein n=1 Tax=Zarea fungicola TaxID=93591 RepID=A0ACC1NFP5_9HYPO|nr:hypothetical protein NQ176_g4259 [Lecanicillium fungicola]